MHGDVLIILLRADEGPSIWKAELQPQNAAERRRVQAGERLPMSDNGIIVTLGGAIATILPPTSS